MSYTSSKYHSFKTTAQWCRNNGMNETLARFAQIEIRQAEREFRSDIEDNDTEHQLGVLYNYTKDILTMMPQRIVPSPSFTD